jgi:hypothetical protein
MSTKGLVRNPTGKGGFGDNPQNRSTGSWSKDSSVSYWYRYFFSLTVEKFKKFPSENPEKIRLMACEIAYNAVLKSRKDLPYLKEITDRTEGRMVISQNSSTVSVTVNPFEELMKKATAKDDE